MSSILADIESHFEPMSGKYCIKHNWSSFLGETYEKEISIMGWYNVKQPTLSYTYLSQCIIRFRCRYYDSKYDDDRFFNMRLSDASYRLIKTTLKENFKNTMTDILVDINCPTIAEVEAVMSPEYLKKLIQEQMVE